MFAKRNPYNICTKVPYCVFSIWHVGSYFSGETMPINPRCLRLLQTIPGLGLPLTVNGKDRSGASFTAKIQEDGSISCNKQTYDSPSRLRAELIAANGPTYSKLLYQNKSLRDWGVI
jgi:hypothetical protein